MQFSFAQSSRFNQSLHKYTFIGIYVDPLHLINFMICQAYGVRKVESQSGEVIALISENKMYQHQVRTNTNSKARSSNKSIKEFPWAWAEMLSSIEICLDLS